MAVEILGLPANIREIPEERGAWLEWQQRALAYRVTARALAEKDAGARADALNMAASDPLADFLLFGSVFEPRDRLNPDGTLRRKGWYPMIPYAFQGKILRWIEQVVSVLPGSSEALMGRGDGLFEKPRGMTWSWTFCGYSASKWKYDDGFIASLMSYKQELVEKTGSTKTLFFKAEGYLGLDPRVPEFSPLRVGDAELLVPVRSPEWMIPKGYIKKEHNTELNLSHPERTNVIQGDATTENFGTGDRATVLFFDECTKFHEFGNTWDAATAVSDHRLGGSSADQRHGTAFKDAAAAARRANEMGEWGPSYLRFEPEDHPERDSVWREEIEARHSGTEASKAAFAREYLMDYEAGSSGYIYREKGTKIVPKALSFSPSVESLDFYIDPGIRDKTAFHLVKYNAALHRYGLMASYVNSGKPAEFYASLYLAMPLYAKYEYGEDEDRIMEWFEQYGKAIRNHVGDPAGKQRGGGNATSFYGEFSRATGELTNGTRPIRIWCSDLPAYKHLQPRHEALRWMLDILDVNDAPDTRLSLQAINEHKKAEEPENREVTSLPTNPVRFWGHDRVTAMEFGAAHQKMKALREQVDEQNNELARLTAGGRPIPERRRANQWGVAA